MIGISPQKLMPVFVFARYTEPLAGLPVRSVTSSCRIRSGTAVAARVAGAGVAATAAARADRSAVTAPSRRGAVVPGRCPARMSAPIAWRSAASSAVDELRANCALATVPVWDRSWAVMSKSEGLSVVPRKGAARAGTTW